VAAEETLMDETAPALDPMAETALRSMKDIVLPSAIPWWPQTWGWAAMAGLITAALLAWFIVAFRQYRRNAYRREAIRLLDGIEERLRPHATRQAAIHEVGLLLKQVAIAAWGRDAVGQLAGKDWAWFLADHGDANDRRLLGKVVDDFEYRNPAVLKRLPGNLGVELAADARRWIEKHHV
jgi:hypothetical protein